MKLEGDLLTWWCPGCHRTHAVTVNVPGGWEWNGDLDRPTLTPSILVHSYRTFIDDELQEPALTNERNIMMTPLCHSFMRAGRLEFLTDCTHELAGQTVPMAPA